MLGEGPSPLQGSWEPEAAWEVRERSSSRHPRKGLPGAGGAPERKPEGSRVGGSGLELGSVQVGQYRYLPAARVCDSKLIHCSQMFSLAQTTYGFA